MPPRTRRPRGHIEPLPSGSFRAVVFTGIDPLTRRRQYVRETCSSRAEAEKALTRLQGQVDENRHPKSSITVATAVEQWMEVADLEVTTRERYEDLIRLYIVPTFGDLQAGRLDAELLERFYARLHRCKSMCGSRPPRGHVCTPLSTSTTRKIHYVLRGALGRAARWGYVSVNAAELAQAPSPRKPRPDPPSAREAADLLNDAWTDPEWGLLLWLTMITGLRRGELCALRWRHVDLDRANLWVERSTAHSRTGLVEKDTKTESQRRLSLDPHTVELLHTHRDTVTKQLAVLGVPLDGGFQPEGWTHTEVKEYRRLANGARAAKVDTDLRNMRLLRIELYADDPAKARVTLSSGRVIGLTFKSSNRPVVLELSSPETDTWLDAEVAIHRRAAQPGERCRPRAVMPVRPSRWSASQPRVRPGCPAPESTRQRGTPGHRRGCADHRTGRSGNASLVPRSALAENSSCRAAPIRSRRWCRLHSSTSMCSRDDVELGSVLISQRGRRRS